MVVLRAAVACASEELGHWQQLWFATTPLTRSKQSISSIKMKLAFILYTAVSSLVAYQ